jgi:hypothetical protein
MVVRKYTRKARAAGRPGWHYGLPAFLIMYLPIFWDHIPTMVVLQYQCMNNAGLTVYKTPEQWKAENPGVADQLIPFDDIKTYRGNGFTYYKLNERFNWETHWRTLPLGLVYADIDRVVDSETNEILVERRDYSTGVGNFLVGGADLRDYKIWLGVPKCSASGRKDMWFFQGKAFIHWKREFGKQLKKE